MAKTLLQLAGAPATPSPWAESTLLLIDHQREYRDGGLPLVGVDAAVTAIAGLLARARATGTPIVHVVHHGRPGGALFAPDGPYAALIADVDRLPAEVQVVKSLPNAFAGTDLAERLAETGRKQLIIGGFMTHNCVAATAWAALDRGFRTTIVADATATRDLPRPAGGVIAAAELQAAVLAGLADRCAIIADSGAL